MLLSVLVTASVTTAQLLVPSTQPPDPSLKYGFPISDICSPCCQSKSFCNTTTLNTTLHTAAGGLANGSVIPSGTNLTCYQQDRRAAGAVNAGRCIPNLDAAFDVETFCSELKGTTPLVNVEYQDSLILTASTCQPCCNGTAICSQGNTCQKAVGQWYGICVPLGANPATNCSTVASNSTLHCELCSTLTFEAQQLSQRLPDIVNAQSSPGPAWGRKLFAPAIYFR